jgi:hypothetical protein
MILRSIRNEWLCIAQREHARLAAEVALAWQAPSCPDGVAWLDIVRAVHHHDDGWEDWDRDPQLDPTTRELRGFTDMRLEDSTVLWRESVLACRDKPAYDGQTHHPAAPIWVARHFAHLARQTARHHPDSTERQECSRLFVEFADEVETEIVQQHGTEAGLSSEALEFGYRAIRWFDLVSLNLCLVTSSDEVPLESPGWGPIVYTFTAEEATLRPWPLSSSSLKLRTSARRLGARTFESPRAFDVVWLSAETIDIEWRLVPS